MQAMRERHSVRAYTDKKITGETAEKLRGAVAEICAESGLNIKLFLDEPNAFSGKMAHYGNFLNCKNYLVIAGKKGSDEKIGYYGEKLVLFAQQLGLNSCWVALTYNKKSVKTVLERGEKAQIVIALGYGANCGVAHKSKPVGQLCKTDGEMPEWFASAMEAAMSAPTAVNQQKFLFTLNGNKVNAKALAGFYTKIDLGIVKYHFELGAGSHKFEWV